MLVTEEIVFTNVGVADRNVWLAVPVKLIDVAPAFAVVVAVKVCGVPSSRTTSEPTGTLRASAPTEIVGLTVPLGTFAVRPVPLVDVGPLTWLNVEPVYIVSV